MSQANNGFFNALLPAERRVVGVVAAISACRMFGLFALLPVLAAWSSDLAGATPVLIGIAVGGYGLTQALLQVPFGALSDRIGRRPVILMGLIVFAAGSVLAATSEGIVGVITGRLLQGAGAISATLAALLADGTRPEVRTRTMALFGVSIGMAFLLALILGPLLALAGGVRSLFWLAAILALVACGLLTLLPRQANAVPRPGSPLSTALRPELLRLDLGIFLLHALLTASFVALPFVLSERLALPAGDHWRVYVTALLLSVAGAIPLILADERRGKGWTFATAVLCLLAGQAILVAQPAGLAGAIAGLAVFFAGFNFLEAALPARLSILADGSARGASLGVFASSQFLGAFAGGLGGGWLLGLGSPQSVFAGGVALAAAWLLMLLPRVRKVAENAGNRAGN